MAQILFTYQINKEKVLYFKDINLTKLLQFVYKLYTYRNNCYKIGMNIQLTNLQSKPSKFYQRKNKNAQLESNLQDNASYPEATIRQYLNQKRTTQNKACLVLFCIYMIAIIMITGIGFFFGNYSSIGVLVNGNGTTVTNCPVYVSQDFATCVNSCSPGTLYIQKVCTTTSPYNPEFSTALDKQISMYNLKSTFIQIIYSSFSLLVLSTVCFLLLICLPKLVYLYVGLLFLMLLGFAFYLLKSIKQNIATLDSLSIFYKDASKILALAYTLLAIYLVIFPFILFSPKKIAVAVKIIGKLSKYFRRMSSVNFFTYLVIYLVWGLLIGQVYFIMNMFSSGTIQTSTTSFFDLFSNTTLSHPAFLAFHLIGVYWFFATIVAWQKYFISSAMCLWYFEEGSKLFPVTRGLKRSWHSLGTATIDAILFPFEWMLLMIYGMSKISQQQKQKFQKEQQQIQNCLCINNLLYKIRQCFNNLYCKCNLNSAASATLTNHDFKQSCQISAVTFAFKNHRFFNLGGTITILLTLFTILLWVIVSYFIMDATVYGTTTPPPISSLVIPIFVIFLMALTIGSLLSNSFTATMDCLIFCYILQKKNNVQVTKNEVKDLLQVLFHQNWEEEDSEKIQMFEYQQE